MKTWLFNWIGGGYNTVRASTREEALRKAKELAPRTKLVVDEETLHVATDAEVRAWDKRYAGMFD